jgi:hypothetical protein
VSLLGAIAHFQAHFANQQSSIGNHQSSLYFVRSDASANLMDGYYSGGILVADAGETPALLEAAP